MHAVEILKQLRLDQVADACCCSCCCCLCRLFTARRTAHSTVLTPQVPSRPSVRPFACNFDVWHWRGHLNESYLGSKAQKCPCFRLPRSPSQKPSFLKMFIGSSKTCLRFFSLFQKFCWKKLLGLLCCSILTLALMSTVRYVNLFSSLLFFVISHDMSWYTHSPTTALKWLSNGMVFLQI